MNECQHPIGIYCSSIRKYPLVQYFKIIFGEYFKFFFCFLSNFTYVGFSLNRLSLVGKTQNKLTIFVTKLRIYKFIILSVSLSILLPVVKALRYNYNKVNRGDDYPIYFEQNTFTFETDKVPNTKYIVIVALNFKCDL